MEGDTIEVRRVQDVPGTLHRGATLDRKRERELLLARTRPGAKAP